MPPTAANPPLLVSVAALIDADGRVLLAKRPPDKPHPDLWEFPGGKVEAGETPEAALVRELHEELTITTDASCLAPLAFASQPWDTHHLLLLLYACRRWQGTPRAASDLIWLPPMRLLDYAMPAPSKPLAALLQDWL